MKRTVLSFVFIMSAVFANAQANDEVKNTAAEKKAMDKYNEDFKKKESLRPTEETSYKNTKSYQAKSPEERAKVDAERQRQEKLLNAMREEQKKKLAPAKQ